LSASLNVESGWNFRAQSKNVWQQSRARLKRSGKIAVQDTLTNLMFTVEVQKDISATPIAELSAGKQYLLNLRVITSQNLNDVKADAISFFQAVDIEQSIEDYIKAYWLFPSKIRFQLVEAEEPT
jgi:hypothetical protein